MILSVSRRTDIPSYYADWFYNRIREGFVCVRNPFSPRQISRIPISPEAVDCIVFWTKNPAPMLSRLGELADYHYYFQFTLTGYGRDAEPGISDKRKVMIPVFQELSRIIGSDRVIWRYDPIFITPKYTEDYHVRAFSAIAGALKGYTNNVVISFIDLYKKTRRNMQGLQLSSIKQEQMLRIAEKMALTAQHCGMEIVSCSQKVSLEAAGVKAGSCISRRQIEQILGCKLKGKKDRNQRAECGCLESMDIGAYHTCRSGCRYCYAGDSQESVQKTAGLYDPEASVLCSQICEAAGDTVSERKVESLKEAQLCLF